MKIRLSDVVWGFAFIVTAIQSRLEMGSVPGR